MNSKEYRITYILNQPGDMSVSTIKSDAPIVDIEAMLNDVYLQASKHVIVEMRDVGPWVKVLEKKAIFVDV